VATGLDRPVFVTAPPGDNDRLFIVEQHTGLIKIRNQQTGTINTTPFLDIDGLATGNEQGLLGLAFHPEYANNSLFYVNFTDSSGTTNIVRYQVSGDPDVANPNSATTVLRYSQPQSNHNGGWLGFSPDGYLYISTGDGGGSDDNDAGHTAGTGNAQDITDNLLGKILRIDVDGDDFPADDMRNYAIPPDNPFVGISGDDEIWSYGLRNPWRCSFDRLTGDLYIGDVGQSAREEVDFQSAADTGGRNYGWRLREGSIATPTGGVGGPPPGAIEPIYDYSHGVGPSEGFVVTGGYVYRGPVASLQGHYIFADYLTEQIWSFRYDGLSLTNFANRTAQFTPDVGSINEISSFGEDAAGNVYIVDLGGEVFQVVSGPVLVATQPPSDGTLPKTQNNIIVLTFDSPIALPVGDPLLITELGDPNNDVSGLFAYSVDPNDPNASTLQATENGDQLADQTWYRVTPPQDLPVEPFALDVATLRGDVNNSARVTTADYSEVKAHMGERTDARYDLNGSARITTADYSVVKANMGHRAPTKP